jgi:DNA-binding IscR family transcriptional regulator
MTEQIEVTPRQNEYLKQLAKAGPQTTRDFTLLLMISTGSAAKMLKKLRESKLVCSQKLKGAIGNVHIHELTAPYADLNIIVTTGGHGGGSSVHRQAKEEEILYAAILRNAGLLGQRLTNQYRKVYPDRPESCVLKQIVTEAKKRGLCR